MLNSKSYVVENGQLVVRRENAPVKQAKPLVNFIGNDGSAMVKIYFEGVNQSGFVVCRKAEIDLIKHRLSLRGLHAIEVIGG